MTRRAIAIRLERSLEARLGRCTRCMTLIGLLVVLLWTLVVALARMQRPIPVLLVAASAVAIPVSLLGVADAVAFVARRVALVPVPTSGTAATEAPHAPSTETNRGGCGCGGMRAPTIPRSEG